MSVQGNLSDYECAVYKEAFALFDADLSGTIEPGEFVAVLTKLGCKCTEDEVIDLLDLQDAGKAARITYPMFLGMYQHDEREDMEIESSEAFRTITGQADGDMTPAMVTKFLAHLDLNLGDVEAKLVVDYGDGEGDKDGKFGLEDFKKMYAKKE